MPNHIKNRIEIIGTRKQVKSIFKKYNTHHKAKLNRAYDDTIICKETETKEFSVGWFNEKLGVFKRRDEADVNGLPDGWEFEINDAYDHFPDFEKVITPPENIFRGDLGAKEKEMCKRENRPTWRDFNIKNWGTKWNSYSCDKLEYNVFTFETAWAGVPKIMEAISEEFPDVEILYEYADENLAYNCGIIKYKNGTQDINILEGGTKEAYDLAFKLRPDWKEDYKLVNGNYECVDDE